ncbi:hypothetical protein ACHAXA_001773 [Cyclostephanos tholiformis]|uniref:Peptidase S1 domain-containing protein n=1 Tax=Cyclostephanos tholiformis TaxID=382380 RepID=A0ABD3RXJ7_9STRA
MVAISKKSVTIGVAVIAVAAIAIALVYSQKKKSTYNALASSTAEGYTPRIIGGATLNRNVWDQSRRYLVSIRKDGHFCGATLVSRRVVLSAARGNPNPPGGFNPAESIDFNRYAQDDNGGVTTIPLCQTENNSCEDTGLAYVIRHQDWRFNTFTNDVALIILPEGRQITTIPPVILNRNPNVPVDGQEVEAFGWGLTNRRPFPGVFPNEIQTGTLEYLTNRECRRLLNANNDQTITGDMMCARTDSTNGVATGGGDSGGPLLSGEVQVGVASYTLVEDITGTNTDPNRPDGFARISFLFDWIRDTVCAEVPLDEVFNCRRSKASKQTKQGKRY